MIEAFERHLTAIDIGKKFNSAKTNQDKIDICKEFLEKQGYEINLKPTKVEFERKPSYKKNLIQGGWPPDDTTILPYHQRNCYSILQAEIQICDIEKYYQIDTDPVYQSQLLHKMMPELAKYMKTTLMTHNPDCNSDTLTAKLGVFKV